MFLFIRGDKPLSCAIDIQMPPFSTLFLVKHLLLLWNSFQVAAALLVSSWASLKLLLPSPCSIGNLFPSKTGCRAALSACYTNKACQCFGETQRLAHWPQPHFSLPFCCFWCEHVCVALFWQAHEPFCFLQGWTICILHILHVGKRAKCRELKNARVTMRNPPPPRPLLLLTSSFADFT